MGKDRQLTTFQQSVYDTIQRVPRGRVTTYASVARALDCGSAQAVGQALRRNPNAPAVPCHRVVAANRTLGGYAGARNGPELMRKRALLIAEGVPFEGDRVAADAIWRF